MKHWEKQKDLHLHLGIGMVRHWVRQKLKDSEKVKLKDLQREKRLVTQKLMETGKDWQKVKQMLKDSVMVKLKEIHWD